MAKEPEKEKGFLARLFSGKKKDKDGKPVLKHDSSSAAEIQQKAALDISRRSALVKNSMGSVQSGKSTDLMGDLADDFHRLKDEKVPAKTEKKGDVWD